MRISGTEPSSMILSQTKQFKKFQMHNQQVPKQVEAKRDGVVNRQITISNNFKHGNFLCSQTLRINRSRP